MVDLNEFTAEHVGLAFFDLLYDHIRKAMPVFPELDDDDEEDCDGER